MGVDAGGVIDAGVGGVATAGGAGPGEADADGPLGNAVAGPGIDADCTGPDDVAGAPGDGAVAGG